MKINWDRVLKTITPPGWKVVASRPHMHGWEYCWETPYGGDFAFSAVVITFDDVNEIGKKNVAAHFAEQLAEHDRDMKAGGRETREHQRLLEQGIADSQKASDIATKGGSRAGGQSDAGGTPPN